jgi:hypothetical protein
MRRWTDAPVDGRSDSASAGYAAEGRAGGAVHAGRKYQDRANAGRPRLPLFIARAQFGAQHEIDFFQLLDPASGKHERNSKAHSRTDPASGQNSETESQPGIKA